MIRVLYILQSWHLGGIETGIKNITSQIKNTTNTFEFFFVATDNTNIHPDFKKIGHTFYSGRNWKSVIEYLKNNKIDILQWGNISEYARCGNEAEVPIIIERISGPRSLGKNHSYNTHMISSSNGLVNNIKKEWNGEISVIHNGVLTDKKIKKQNLWFLEKDKFVVVYPSARMGEGQNYQMLIEAVKRAKIKNNNICLILMGDHPEHAAYPSIKKKLYNLAKPLGNDCVFTGFMLDPDPIIAGSNLCCVPAKSHGISNALINASSFGLPIISTNVGQNNEICFHNKNGYMVKLNDIDLMAKYILELSLNKEKCIKFGENGKSIVKESFNIETQSLKYINLYHYLVSKYIK